MSSFSLLKTNRSNVTETLTKELEKLNTKTQMDDDDANYWQPTVDKLGNGQAIFRFLPPPEGEDMPFVRYWKHSFKGPTGQWYIERSLSSLGLPDPCGEENSRLWNTGLESDKKISRDRKRKLYYVSNIYMIKDYGNPENDGKVFLFQYGKKIFDKINDIMRPEFEGDAKINPFDFWEGANFKLRVRNVEGYRNYDKSEFDQPSVLNSSDEELEKIWKQQFSLKEIVDPSRFKTYEQLKERLLKAIGTPSASKPLTNVNTERKTTSNVNPPWLDEDNSNDETANDDPDVSYFKRLAEK